MQALFSTQKTLLAISAFDTTPTYSCRNSWQALLWTQKILIALTLCIKTNKEIARIIFCQKTLLAIIPPTHTFPLFPYMYLQTILFTMTKWKLPSLLPIQTSLTHSFLLCYCKSYTSISFHSTWDGKGNTWAELSNIVTVYTTLVYRSLDNVIGCDIVVPRHWHPSCLHRYPETKINTASCMLSCTWM